MIIILNWFWLSVYAYLRYYIKRLKNIVFIYYFKIYIISLRGYLHKNKVKSKILDF